MGLVAIAHNLSRYIACKQANADKKMLEITPIEKDDRCCMAA